MAKEVKNKSAQAEQAIKRLVDQMPKEVTKRAWTPGGFSALITYLAEAHGAKFDKPENRKAFMADMRDGDFAYSSNMKKYLADRAMLPGGEAVATEYN